MKNIKDYIEEELFATPMDTMGMGNPTDCSGDCICFNAKGKRKRRKKKAKKDNEKQFCYFYINQYKKKYVF